MTTSAEKNNLAARLKEQGYQGVDLFEQIATRTVEIKERSRTNRCGRCWHDKKSRCICSYIPLIHASKVLLPVKILVLMHYKEYFSAGNDAKLLLAMLPCTELFIFGKKGDWENFEAEYILDSSHTVILWPSEDAMTVENFIDTCDWPWRDCRRHPENNGTTTRTRPTLRVVVLDGVYSQARTMFRTIQKRIRIPLCKNTVALHPKTLSVYHRAQKTYATSSATTVQKSKDPNALHICTVEAVALLLQELGEGEETTRALVEAVEINNLALDHDKNVRPPATT